jgi:hypothetical protein
MAAVIWFPGAGREKRGMVLAIAALAAELILLPSPVVLGWGRAPTALWMCDAVLVVLLPPALAIAALFTSFARNQRPTPDHRLASSRTASKLAVCLLVLHSALLCGGLLMFTELHRLLYLVLQSLEGG